ncbi:hypothetical protein SAMN02745129_2565 [Ferrimonas marina]|uniref:Ig-like domain-containing protein n=1 Tax=Ferrimonas marina TaxID=299255 RepID=A0A1M5UGT1_9GAMM|nr:hypothetical protein SAMN02745129_2565 [Ferrimonas marina]
MKLRQLLILLGLLAATSTGVAMAKQWHSGIVTTASDISSTPLVTGSSGSTTPSYTAPSLSLSCNRTSCKHHVSSYSGSAYASVTVSASASCPHGSCSYSWTYGSTNPGTASISGNSRTWGISRTTSGESKRQGTVTVRVTDSTSKLSTTRSVYVDAVATFTQLQSQTAVLNCSSGTLSYTCTAGSQIRSETSPGVWGSWTQVQAPVCAANALQCFGGGGGGCVGQGDCDLDKDDR